MKKFAKLITILTLVAIVMATLLLTTACGETPNDGDETPWDGRTYTITVQLPDGSGVEGLSLALCYNTSATTNSCLNAVTTDTNGKVEIVIPEGTEIVGNPVLHFAKKKGSYNIPNGYAMPENVGAVVMNHPADTSNADIQDYYTYEYAIELTGANTTLTLAEA